MRGWSKMFKAEVVAACGESQYGVGSPGACVKMRHDMLLEWVLDPTKALVGIDLANMHNSVKTARLETQVAHKIPRMAELLVWLRSERTHIYKDEYGEVHKVLPRDGLDQGCPASNALAPIAVAEAHGDLAAFRAVFGLQDDTYVLTTRHQVHSLCDSLDRVFAPGSCRQVF